MATKKYLLSRRRKQSRRIRNRRSRKISGGCKDGNCLFQSQQQPLPPTLPHSNYSQAGGNGPFAPSFSNVPLRSFYPLNTYETDPSRLISTLRGGRKSRRKSQRGGLGISSLFSYGASMQPSNVADLKLHNNTRPYA